MLAYRAEELPDRRVFTMVEPDQDEQTLTYLALHRKAQDIAALLLERMPQGARALLLFPPGFDYVCALYGCFQAGIVAVSAPPPQPNRLHRTLPRLQAIAADAEITAVLTTDFIREAAQSDAAGSFLEDGPLTEVQWIATDTAPEGGEVEVARPPLSELTFLQYTSGSTRAPRGVMLSHENLDDNLHSIAHSLGHVPPDDIQGLMWLPPYHDMGLIAGVLHPVHIGARCVLMSPLTVIKRPARWLEAVSKYGVTTSGGPNFAYDLCVRRIDLETCEQLDLSSWKVAFNGAEPIRAETLDAFCEKFGPCGFTRDAFQAGYGLAEATLLVTTGATEKEPTLLEVDERALEDGFVRPATGGGPAKVLVGSGSLLEGTKVAIVDAEGRRREDDEIGEIWFSGRGVALGYWRDPEETAEAFAVTLADEPDTPYLRTGDLGAIVDGELYVVGRIKELIIVNGRNIYPHDIEYSAEAASPLVRSHCGAAFEQEVEGEVRIAMLLEVDLPENEEGYEEIMAAVRKRVAEDLDLPLYWIGLCSRGTVPKTTSGKIQRRLCKALVVDGDVELLAEYPRRKA
ncbi:MAG TPA: fatty acyl-AMP ligase [Solirubrobacterales bacterium]|nr:fatty acyl-AMP ligase [Solirubrobacterales bacterium]